MHSPSERAPTPVGSSFWTSASAASAAASGTPSWAAACLVEQPDDVGGHRGEARVRGFGADLPCQVLGKARPRAGALVDAWPVLSGQAAELAPPVGVEGIAIAVDRRRIDVERPVLLRAALADELVGGRAFETGAPGLVGLGPSGTVVGRGAQFEQRVGLKHLGDEGLDLEVRQREELDCLLQLRRHHQRLTQGLFGPQVKARTDRHRAYSVKPSPR
jgi:hypothetical protein